jgi:hypothetical protein
MSRRQSDRRECWSIFEIDASIIGVPKLHWCVAKQTQDFLMVWAAVTPVKVLPAPQGKTIIMPDLARPYCQTFFGQTAFWITANSRNGFQIK